MKNNPNTKYVLIALVILIWGLIIYRVVSGLSGDDVVVPVSTYKPKPKVETDTVYSLVSVDYPDPFANELPVRALIKDTVIRNTTQSVTIPPQTNPIAAIPLAQPPIIKYNGYIYNPQTRKRTALLSYNGRTMTVAVADKLDAKTTIIKIDEQKVVFSFKGKRVVVPIGG